MNIVAYIPAIHRGYIDFIAKQNSRTVFVLDVPLVKTVFPIIERDVRALPAKDIARMLQALGTAAEVLTQEKVPKVTEPIVMPDEDVSHLFAKRYLADKDVRFELHHLRWDGWGTAKETPVPPDRMVSTETLDKEMVAIAQKTAQHSPDWWRQVGAALVKDGKVLIAGHNRPSPTKAYELNALGDPRSNFDAGQRYDLTTAEHGEAHIIGLAAGKGLALQGASIYVTTFPCPTCAKLILAAGIKKVYYAEGYSLVDAEDVLRNSGVEIILVKS